MTRFPNWLKSNTAQGLCNMPTKSPSNFDGLKKIKSQFSQFVDARS